MIFLHRRENDHAGWCDIGFVNVASIEEAARILGRNIVLVSPLSGRGLLETFPDEKRQYSLILGREIVGIEPLRYKNQEEGDPAVNFIRRMLTGVVPDFPDPLHGDGSK